MVARNTNVPFKGRIQMRKTNHLQIVAFGLQRAAGPYRWAKMRHGKAAALGANQILAKMIDVDGPLIQVSVLSIKLSL
jgi:hypothetical protein